MRAGEPGKPLIWGYLATCNRPSTVLRVRTLPKTKAPHTEDCAAGRARYCAAVTATESLPCVGRSRRDAGSVCHAHERTVRYCLPSQADGRSRRPAARPVGLLIRVEYDVVIVTVLEAYGQRQLQRPTPGLVQDATPQTSTEHMQFCFGHGAF